MIQVALDTRFVFPFSNTEIRMTTKKNMVYYVLLVSNLMSRANSNMVCSCLLVNMNIYTHMYICRCIYIYINVYLSMCLMKRLIIIKGKKTKHEGNEMSVSKSFVIIFSSCKNMLVMLDLLLIMIIAKI